MQEKCQVLDRVNKNTKREIFPCFYSNDGGKKHDKDKDQIISYGKLSISVVKNPYYPSLLSFPSCVYGSIFTQSERSEKFEVAKLVDKSIQM